MSRARGRALLWVCGLSSLLACVSPEAHVEPSSERTRADCSGCHEREYKNAPRHVDAKPTRCAACHSESSWQPTQLSHSWALTGSHAKADCASCHKGWSPQYEHTEATCVGCHRNVYEKAEHALVSGSCQDCHNTTGWQPAKRPPPAQLQQLIAAAPAPVAPEPAPQPTTAPISAPNIANDATTPAVKQPARKRGRRANKTASTRSNAATPSAAKPVAAKLPSAPPPAAAPSPIALASRASRPVEATTSQPAAHANTALRSQPLTAAVARRKLVDAVPSAAEAASAPQPKPLDVRRPRPPSLDGKAAAPNVSARQKAGTASLPGPKPQ